MDFANCKHILTRSQDCGRQLWRQRCRNSHHTLFPRRRCGTLPDDPRTAKDRPQVALSAKNAALLCDVLRSVSECSWTMPHRHSLDYFCSVLNSNLCDLLEKSDALTLKKFFYTSCQLINFTNINKQLSRVSRPRQLTMHTSKSYRLLQMRIIKPAVAYVRLRF